jgi:hypothetical protein
MDEQRLNVAHSCIIGYSQYQRRPPDAVLAVDIDVVSLEKVLKRFACVDSGYVHWTWAGRSGVVDIYPGIVEQDFDNRR